MEHRIDTIREEAEHWYARRRDGARMPDQEAEFQRWLQRSPLHARAYLATERSWEELQGLRSSARLRELTADAMRATAPPRLDRSGGRRWLLLAAALAVLAVFSAWRFLPLVVQEGAPQLHATALGEQRSESLPDGTRVILNTDTALEVRYRRDRREISLRRGEAMFEVAPDARRPFVVAVAGGTVTALGTRFQVRRDGETVGVTLLEGTVEVARVESRERRRLAPGERAEFQVPGNGITVQSVDPEAATRWTHGRLDFQRMRLADAVAEANRYSAQKLRLGSPELGDMQVSGNFRVGDNAGIAAAFAAVFPVRVGDADGSSIVLLPADKAR